MTKSAARCYLLFDHEKFGRTALHFLADLDGLDGVVTSAPLDVDATAELRERAIRLHVAGEKTE